MGGGPRGGEPRDQQRALGRSFCNLGNRKHPRACCLMTLTQRPVFVRGNAPCPRRRCLSVARSINSSFGVDPVGGKLRSAASSVFLQTISPQLIKRQISPLLKTGDVERQRLAVVLDPLLSRPYKRRVGSRTTTGSGSGSRPRRRPWHAPAMRASPRAGPDMKRAWASVAWSRLLGDRECRRLSRAQNHRTLSRPCVPGSSREGHVVHHWSMQGYRKRHELISPTGLTPAAAMPTQNGAADQELRRGIRSRARAQKRC